MLCWRTIGLHTITRCSKCRIAAADSICWTEVRMQLPCQRSTQHKHIPNFPMGVKFDCGLFSGLSSVHIWGVPIKTNQTRYSPRKDEPLTYSPAVHLQVNTLDVYKIHFAPLNKWNTRIYPEFKVSHVSSIPTGAEWILSTVCFPITIQGRITLLYKTGLLGFNGINRIDLI